MISKAFSWKWTATNSINKTPKNYTRFRRLVKFSKNCLCHMTDQPTLPTSSDKRCCVSEKIKSAFWSLRYHISLLAFFTTPNHKGVSRTRNFLYLSSISSVIENKFVCNEAMLSLSVIKPISVFKYLCMLVWFVSANGV